MRRPLTVLAALALAAGVSPLVSPAATAAPAPQANDTARPPSPDELLVAYRAGSSAADRDRARGRVNGQRAERVVPAAADRLEVERVRLPQGSDRAARSATCRPTPPSRTPSRTTC